MFTNNSSHFFEKNEKITNFEMKVILKPLRNNLIIKNLILTSYDKWYHIGLSEKQ